MKISVNQINPLIGDLERNFYKIKNAYLKSVDQGADICVFPELSTSGYLARDLFLKPSFIDAIEAKITLLTNLSQRTCLLLPTVYRQDSKLHNGVIALQNGKIIGRTSKKHLPNYGIFDEKRYFAEGSPQVIEVNGHKIGVPICEDIWFQDVCLDLKNQGAEIFIVPNGSPFEKDKFQQRLNVIENRFQETKIPFIYCNQSSAVDGIVFEGKSFAYDSKLIKLAGVCEESEALIECYKNNISIKYNKLIEDVSTIAEIYKVMVFGVKEYVKNNGFTKVVLGLSGGIDSALVACICRDALGKDNVTAVMLPSKFSSQQSRSDATELANKLGIKLKEVKISEAVESAARSLGRDVNWENADLTLQNMQSRMRGLLLMAIANDEKALLITTGNKSEYATGYATIYGDMNGAFNPIKDVYKTEVYKLSHFRNGIGKVIPKSILTKAPSAELTANQKDSDNLPEYEILDAILELYIEQNLSKKEISFKFPEDIVEKVIRLVSISEFKRQQSAPGIKISSCAFDLDRRYPITNYFK